MALENVSNRRRYNTSGALEVPYAAVPKWRPVCAYRDDVGVGVCFANWPQPARRQAALCCHHGRCRTDPPRNLLTHGARDDALESGVKKFNSVRKSRAFSSHELQALAMGEADVPDGTVLG